MKNNQNNKHKHVLFIYSTQGITKLSLAVVYGLVSVAKTVARPLFNLRHHKGSTSRARALSLYGVFFAVLNSTFGLFVRHSGSTSRARALSQTGVQKHTGLQADSTSRARALDLFGALFNRTKKFQLEASSTSRARALSLLWAGKEQSGQTDSTSRARALSLSGFFGNKAGLRTSSTSRARALSLFGALLVVMVLLPLATHYSPFTGKAHAATSNQLNFQGRLLTNTGGLVPDGTYNFQFDLYYQAVGGSSQWTEDRLNVNAQGVTIRNGYFSVYLGEYDAIPALNWSEDLYLGMTVRGTGSCAWGACTPADSQMTPRFKLTAVPYAFRAANVASSSTNAASTNSDGVSITTGNAAGSTSNSGNITIDSGTATGTTGSISLGASNASALTIGNGSATTSLQGQVAVTGSGTALQVTNSATIGGTLGVTGLTTASGGLTVGTGSNFINQGSTLFSSLAISDVSGGGNIGSAATTVDVATTFNVNQTTAGQTLTLPSPTTATAGRIAFVNNVGSVSFEIYGSVIGVGQSNTFIWNGSSWVTTVSLSSNVVNVVGTINSQTKSADGAVISANAIYLQTADDTYPGLVSTIAQTFAGVKTFNDGIVLAANQTLTVTGGTTANRPGAPTEGMIYFDTDTDSLLVYANGKWQADRTSVSKTVAPNNASQAIKDSADYVADGTSDEDEINAALTAAAGGKVYLFEGIFVADGTILIPNNTTLAGAGNGTVVELADLDVDAVLVENQDSTTGTGVVLRDLTLDGRSDLNTAGIQSAVRLNGMGNSTNRSGGAINNVTARNVRSYGFYILSSSGNTITGNTAFNISAWGFVVDNSHLNVFSSNVSRSTSRGFQIQGSSQFNSFTNNVVASSSSYGFALGTAHNNTISSNTIRNSGSTSANNAIYLDSSDNNLIASNAITDSSATTTNYAINISNSGSDTNYLADNSLGGGSISDAGTGTIYGGQLDGSNNYVIQPAGGISLNANTSVTGSLVVSGLITANGGLTVASGQNFVNQGSTLFSSMAISDVSGGGNIGSAATTVDIATTFNVNQTTAGQILTLPSPTVATSGRIAFVNNIGSVSFEMYGSVMAAGQSNTFIWNGSSWVTTVSLSGSVVNVIGTLDSQTKSLDGAVIGANAIYLQTADVSNPGLVSIGSQTFNGVKTFDDGAVITAGGLTITAGGLAVTGTTNINTTGTDATNIGNTSAPISIQGQGAATSTDLVNFRVNGDTNDRFVIDADGTIRWGSGSGAPDVFLTRVGTDILQTGDYIRVAQNVIGNAALSVMSLSDTDSAFKVRARAAQAVDLIQIQDNGGGVLSGFNVSGNLFYSNSTYSSVLSSATLTNNQSIVLPDASGTVLLDSTLAATAFIQNGNLFGATAVLGTNDNNSLVFRTNSTTALTIDTSQNALFAGTVTATGLATFNGDLRISDGSSNYATIDVSALAGDYTISIPTITANDEFCLLSLENCKNASTDEIITVAADNSSAAAKAAADFVADGISDEDEINAALTLAAGGVVHLLPGTYIADGTILIPNNTRLEGEGNGTIIELDDIDTADNLMEATGTNRTGQVVRDLKIDGRNDLNTAGLNYGIYFNGVGDAGTRSGGVIENVNIQNFRGAGIHLTNSDNNIVSTNTITSSNVNSSFDISGSSGNTITGNIVRNATGSANGFVILSSSSNNTITGNTAENNVLIGFNISLSSGNTITSNISRNNGTTGFSVSLSSNNTLSGNVAQGNGWSGFSVGSGGSDRNSIVGNISISNTENGITIQGNGNTVTGNTVVGNSQYGIMLNTGHYSVVTSNGVHDNGGANTNNGIYVQNADFSSIVNNNITDTSCNTTCYAVNISSSGSDQNYLEGNRYSDTDADSGDDASINDAGTDTIYAGQSTGTTTGTSVSNFVFRGVNSATAFAVQSAAGTSVLNVDTSTAGVGITGTLTVSGLATFNGGLTLEAGDTLTVNGDALTDLTGSGLTVVSNALTVDSTTATGFFRNGGNAFTANSTLGNTGNYSLNFMTNNINRITIANSGDTTIRGNLHVRNTGDSANVMTFSQADNLSTNSDIAFNSAALISAQDDFIINIDSNNNDTNRSFIIAKDSATTGGSYAQLFQVREAGDVNIVSGALLTGNTSRLTNAGALQNISGYTQTSGNFDFNSAGNFAVDTNVLYVSASSDRVGIGTTTLNNGVLTVSGTAPTGVTSGGIFVNTTLSSTTNNQSGVRSVPVVSPGSASTQAYYGFVASASSSSSNLTGATLGGMYGGGYYDGTGTVGSMYGVYAANELDTATGSIGTAASLFAADTYTAGGTITNNYGLFVETINAGTNNYGIYVQNATTYAIWVDSGATRLDGTLEVQSAATFGSTLAVTTLGTADTNTYLCRNSANIISGCLSAPLSSLLVDNIADALDIQEGTNNYINISTINGSENISFGNTTTNPTYSFLGSGATSLGGNLAVQGGELNLTNGTSNLVNFGTNGVGVPTFTTRSAGTKIVLNAALSPADADYALGIDANTMWSSIQRATSAYKFAWYGGQTEIATLNGEGDFALTGDLAVAGLATFNGDLRISDGSSNYATIDVSALSGDYTISIPTVTGNDEFCLRTTLNCTGAGTNEIITVAADDSSADAKAAADYVADGTSDEDEINAALTAAAGGKVVLLEGTFVADGTILIPNNTTMEGSGRGTVIELADIDTTDNLIEATGTNRTGQTVKNLTIDGRNDLNTAGTQHGIRLDSVGDSASNRPGATLENITVQNFRNNGIFIFGSDNNSITSNMIQSNDGNGITLDDESEYNTVSNNIVKDNSTGISLEADSHNNTVIGNIVQASSGSYGILLSSSSNTAVANNTVSGYYYNLYFDSSSNNTITSNVAHSGEYGFWFQSTSTDNTFTANIAENNAETGLFMGWDTNSNTITGNIIKGNNVGVYTNSFYSNFIGNTVQGNSASGFNLNGSNNIVSDNKIHDNGGSTGNSGIFIGYDADFNSIIGNHITDTACTTTCYAINISDSTADKNYLEGNRFSGSAANAASINDAGTNTIYVNQQVNSTTSTNSDVSDFRLQGSANSATAFAVRTSGGTTVLNVNTSTPGVGITGTLTVSGLATFNGGLTLEAGDTLTVNGDALTDLTGAGLTVVGNALTVDATSATGFFQNGGNNFGGNATLGTNGATQTLTFETNNTNRFVLSATASTLTGQGATILTSTGAMNVTSASGANALTLDSGTTGNVNLGNGANAKAITIGNTTSTTSLLLQAGTGDVAIQSQDDINIGTNAVAQDITIGNGTGATSVTINAGTGALNIGTNAVARTIAVGNTTGASALNLRVGTGNFTLDGVAGSTYTLGASTTTGTITIGGTAQTGNLTLGSSSGTNSVLIGNGSGATTVNIANVTTGGAVNIGAAMTTGTITIGGTGAQTGTIALGIGTGGQNINLGTGAGAKILALGSTNTTSSTTINAGSGFINFNATQAQFTEVTGTRELTVQTRTTNVAGSNLRISAGNAGTGGSAFVGGVLTLQGGNAAGTGNANGGNVVITGGTGVGTGVRGLIVLDTATFDTATNQNSNDSVSGSTTAITTANINTYGAIRLTATGTSQIFTMADPTNTTAGRIIYVSNVGSNDFTLSVNGGGTGNTIALKPNTTATMYWNGSDWTAAGASSSTDLQAAYNNTATSAGGAELVLNAPGGSADGLTIRNNATTPITGGLLEVQTSIGSNLFTVNNNATEYATNGGAETAGGSATTFPSNTWDATTGGTVTRYITTGNYIATGQASVSVVTGATANHGARNRINATLTSGLTYTVSFAVRSTASFSTLQVYYSENGTTATALCATAQTVTYGQWTRITCSFVASGTITSSNSILIRQTDATARTFYIDNLSVNVNASVTYAADGSADIAGGFPTTNWSNYQPSGTATVAQETTIIYDSNGSARVTTSATAGIGMRNNLAVPPAINTQYLVSFYARSSVAMNDTLRVGFLPTGGTGAPSGDAACTDYSTRTLTTTAWVKVTCLFTTAATTITNADLVIYQSDATARIIYVDALSITLNTNNSNNVQIGGANKGGPVTLFTLDRSAGSPIAANNDAYLGSMYYDTVTGRIQCYEADGWGACGAAPDNIVNLNPEYAGAVLNGSGVGVMSADFCGNGAGLSINTSLCASGEAKNYYKWTSPQASMQTYSIFVTYQLPATFDGFTNDDTVQLAARVDSTTNASVTYEMYKSAGGSLTQCGSGETDVIVGDGTGAYGSANTWYSYGVNGNEATGCSFNASTANGFVIFKINVKARSNASAYVGTLNFVTAGR